MNIKPPRHCFGFSLAWGWQFMIEVPTYKYLSLLYQSSNLLEISLTGCVRIKTAEMCRLTPTTKNQNCGYFFVRILLIMDYNGQSEHVCVWCVCVCVWQYGK